MVEWLSPYYNLGNKDMKRFFKWIADKFRSIRHPKKFESDPRNEGYGIPQEFLDNTVNLVSKRWETPMVLNQGATAKCVAYALTLQLISNPNNKLGGIITRHDVRKFINNLYTEIQRNDRRAGENYQGTWVEDGLKLLVRLHYYKAFYWALDIETALTTLSTKGTLVCKVYMGSFTSINKTTGAANYVPSTKYPHGILLHEIDVENKVVWFQNSYSTRWGLRGRFSVTYEEFNHMLHHGCTASLPVS